MGGYIEERHILAFEGVQEKGVMKVRTVLYGRTGRTIMSTNTCVQL